MVHRSPRDHWAGNTPLHVEPHPRLSTNSGRRHSTCDGCRGRRVTVLRHSAASFGRQPAYEGYWVGSVRDDHGSTATRRASRPRRCPQPPCPSVFCERCIRTRRKLPATLSPERLRISWLPARNRAHPGGHLLLNSPVSPVFHGILVTVPVLAIARPVYGSDRSDNRVPGNASVIGSRLNEVPGLSRTGASRRGQDRPGNRILAALLPPGSPVSEHLAKRKTICGRMPMQLIYAMRTPPQRQGAMARGARYMKYEFRQ